MRVMARKKKSSYLSDSDSELTKPGAGETPNKGDAAYETKEWTKTIQSTMAWRDRIAQRHRWQDFISEFKGDWSHVSNTVDIPLMPVNMVYAYTKTEIARLYFRDPWITVNAKKQEELGAADIAEALINYVWSEINLKQEVKRALLDALLVGHGWVKLGYSAEFGTAESKEQSEEPVQEVTVNQFIKAEEVFAYHIPWKDVLFSPDSLRPPHDSRWMAFRITRPLRAVQESGIYENTEDLKANLETEDMYKTDTNKNIQTVTLWEIWDLDHKEVKTLAIGHDKWLRKIPWPYTKMTGFPAVMYHFNIVPQEPYPLSDIAPGEAQVVESMKMMAIMLNHLKRWNRQIFIKEGFMTDIEEAKFKQAIDGAIVKTEGNPAEGIYIPSYAPVQQDIYAVWNLILDIFRNVMGQSEVDRGGQANAQTRTLGELRAQLQGGRSRSEERIDMLEDQISEMATKLMMIMKEKLSKPRIVRMVGQKAVDEAMQLSIQNRPSAGMTGATTGQQSFSVTGADLPDDMDIDVVAGSTTPLNKENKLNILGEFMKESQAFGIQPGSQAARDLGRAILKEIDVKELDQIMDIADKEAATGQTQQQQQIQAEQQAQQQKDQVAMQQEMVRLEAAKAQAEGSKATALAQVQSTQTKSQIDAQLAQLKIAVAKMEAETAQIKAQEEIQLSKMKNEEMLIKKLLDNHRMGMEHDMNGRKNGLL